MASINAGSWALVNTGVGRVCGTSESIEPTLITLEQPTASATSRTASQYARQRNWGSGALTSTTEVGPGEHHPKRVLGQLSDDTTPASTTIRGRFTEKSTNSSGSISASGCAPHAWNRCSTAPDAASPASFHPVKPATITERVEPVTAGPGREVQMTCPTTATVSLLSAAHDRALGDLT